METATIQQFFQTLKASGLSERPQLLPDSADYRPDDRPDYQARLDKPVLRREPPASYCDQLADRLKLEVRLSAKVCPLSSPAVLKGCPANRATLTVHWKVSIRV